MRMRANDAMIDASRHDGAREARRVRKSVARFDAAHARLILSRYEVQANQKVEKKDEEAAREGKTRYAINVADFSIRHTDDAHCHIRLPTEINMMTRHTPIN